MVPPNYYVRLHTLMRFDNVIDVNDRDDEFSWSREVQPTADKMISARRAAAGSRGRPMLEDGDNAAVQLQKASLRDLGPVSIAMVGDTN